MCSYDPSRLTAGRDRIAVGGEIAPGSDDQRLIIGRAITGLDVR